MLYKHAFLLGSRLVNLRIAIPVGVVKAAG
jgi:hypothetical protein